VTKSKILDAIAVDKPRLRNRREGVVTDRFFLPVFWQDSWKLRTMNKKVNRKRSRSKVYALLCKVKTNSLLRSAREAWRRYREKKEIDRLIDHL
jgi:hypothetical protein